MRHQYPGFHFQTERGQRIGGAIDPSVQVAVSVAPGIVDIGDLVESTGIEMLVDKMHRRIEASRHRIRVIVAVVHC